MLSGLGIRFQNLNLLHFYQIIGLKSLSIQYLFLLAQLNLGIEMDRLPEREREAYFSGVGTYLPGTVVQAVKRCRNLPHRHCGAGLQAV